MCSYPWNHLRLPAISRGYLGIDCAWYLHAWAFASGITGSPTATPKCPTRTAKVCCHRLRASIINVYNENFMQSSGDTGRGISIHPLDTALTACLLFALPLDDRRNFSFLRDRRVIRTGAFLATATAFALLLFFYCWIANHDVIVQQWNR